MDENYKPTKELALNAYRMADSLKNKRDFIPAVDSDIERVQEEEGWKFRISDGEYATYEDQYGRWMIEFKDGKKWIMQDQDGNFVGYEFN